MFETLRDALSLVVRLDHQVLAIVWLSFKVSLAALIGLPLGALTVLPHPNSLPSGHVVGEGQRVARFGKNLQRWRCRPIGKAGAEKRGQGEIPDRPDRGNVRREKTVEESRRSRALGRRRPTQEAGRGTGARAVRRPGSRQLSGARRAAAALGGSARRSESTSGQSQQG